MLEYLTLLETLDTLKIDRNKLYDHIARKKIRPCFYAEVTLINYVSDSYNLDDDSIMCHLDFRGYITPVYDNIISILKHKENVIVPIKKVFIIENMSNSNHFYYIDEETSYFEALSKVQFDKSYEIQKNDSNIHEYKFFSDECLFLKSEVLNMAFIPSVKNKADERDLSIQTCLSKNDKEIFSELQSKQNSLNAHKKNFPYRESEKRAIEFWMNNRKVSYAEFSRMYAAQFNVTPDTLARWIGKYEKSIRTDKNSK